MNVPTKLTQLWTRRVFVVLVVMVAVVGCASPTAASPSPPPAAYYGNLTVNDEPAPAGLSITAEINGEVQGSLTTTQAGAYGGSGAFDPKLQVDGQNSDEGTTVQFFVEGHLAGTTTWHSGDVRAVDLSADGVDVDSVGQTETPQDTGGSGSSGGSSGGASDATDTSGSSQTTSPTLTPTTGANTGGFDAVTSSGADRITVTTNGSSAAVNVIGARSGQQVTINLSSTIDAGSETASSMNSSTESDNITFDALTINPMVDGNFTLDVSVTETVPEGTPTPPDDVAAAGYFVVDHSLPDDDISGVTFSFRVRKSRLTAMSIAPEEMTLYRLHDGAWTELQTTPKGETATHYVFETASPGLSVFALGTTSKATPSQGTVSGDLTGEPTMTDSSTVDANVGTPTTSTQKTTESSIPAVAFGLGAGVALAAALLAVRRYR